MVLPYHWPDGIIRRLRPHGDVSSQKIQIQLREDEHQSLLLRVRDLQHQLNEKHNLLQKAYATIGELAMNAAKAKEPKQAMKTKKPKKQMKSMKA